MAKALAAEVVSVAQNAETPPRRQYSFVVHRLLFANRRSAQPCDTRTAGVASQLLQPLAEPSVIRSFAPIMQDWGADPAQPTRAAMTDPGRSITRATANCRAVDFSRFS